MDDWLAEKRRALIQAVPEVERAGLSDTEVDELLDLARLAAHESGDRRNAPLLCYLVGLAQGGGTPLPELVGAVRRSTQ